MSLPGRAAILALAVTVFVGARTAQSAAPSCAVLGDSLAVGVGAAAPKCALLARVGISSPDYARALTAPVAADVVVISLGANDAEDVSTLAALAAVRGAVAAGAVWWIVPARPERVRTVIIGVARALGDRRIDTRAAVGPDGLHLDADGYRAVTAIIGIGGSARP